MQHTLGLTTAIIIGLLHGTTMAQADNVHAVPTAPADYLAMSNPFGPENQEAVKWGERLYKSKCRKCHGAEGDGKGSNAEYLDIKPVAFAKAGYLAQRKDGQLLWIIENGSPGTEMPSHGRGSRDDLPVEELWKLVSYLRSAFTR
ncbi:MAG: c-type cytochrome [Magnetococcales bacterium]|nr:c-type cytochrome [Magnetococcales bacterium]